MYDRLRGLIKGDAKGQERNNAMPVRKKFEFYEEDVERLIKEYCSLFPD